MSDALRSPRPSLLVLVGIAVLAALAVSRTAEIRQRAEAGLGEGMPPREAALARGFVLGDDEEVDETTKEDFIRAGLSHLLAVSGENVTLLTLLAMPVLAMFGVPLRERLVWVIALIAVYVPLAGSGPSIQRAGVMGVVGLVATLSGRRASRLYALGLAGVVTVAINPSAASNVGWQLSFAAVLGILLLAAPIRTWLVARSAVGWWQARPALPDLAPAHVAGDSRGASPRGSWLGDRGARGAADPPPLRAGSGASAPVGPWRRALAEGIAVTIAATLATAPLIAYVFEEVSVTSLAANVLALPAVAPAMWLGMVSAVLAQVPGIPLTPLNGLDAMLLAYVAQVAAWCGRPSWAVIHLHIGLAAMFATYASMAATIALAAAWSRSRRLAAARASAPAVAVDSTGAPSSAVDQTGAVGGQGRSHSAGPTGAVDIRQPDATAVDLSQPMAYAGRPHSESSAPAVDPASETTEAVDPASGPGDAVDSASGNRALGRPRSGSRSKGRPRRGRRSLAAGGALLGVVGLLWLVARPRQSGTAAGPEPGLRIEVLDVGQGDSILLQPRNAPAVIVDGGPPGDELVSKLGEEGVESLGAAVVTHDQSDHAAGIAEALGRVPIGRLVYGRLDRKFLAAAKAVGARPEGVAAGTTLRSGPLRLEVIWPPREALTEDPPDTDPNLLALVMVARWHRFTMLLTADAEAETTPLDPGPIDVLKVAHHGSDDAGLGPLLDRIRPRLAVISVGADNPYGHPTPGTLATLAEHGVPTLRTDQDGKVEIDVTRRSFTVDPPP
jgi:ComEC/Rec2-related protein